MNNKSDKPEHLVPQDSKEKDIKHPQDDQEAVVKRRDRTYKEEDADFGNIAERKEKREQPVNPVAPPPKDV